MSDTRESDAPERTLLTTRREYLGAADRLIALARRELRIFDPGLREIDFNAPERIAALRALLAADRNHRVLVALHDVEHVMQRCPRLLELIGTFSRGIIIHRTEGEAARAQDCFIIADDMHVLRRPAATQPRGVLFLNDPMESHLMRERFDQIWESSELGVSASKVGL